MSISKTQTPWKVTKLQLLKLTCKYTTKENNVLEITIENIMIYRTQQVSNKNLDNKEKQLTLPLTYILCLNELVSDIL